MSNRTALKNAILDYVSGSQAAGAVIDVNNAAIHLSSTYPQSGLAIEEICREIENAAVRAGVPVLAGNRPAA